MYTKFGVVFMKNNQGKMSLIIFLPSLNITHAKIVGIFLIMCDFEYAIIRSVLPNCLLGCSSKQVVWILVELIPSKNAWSCQLLLIMDDICKLFFECTIGESKLRNFRAWILLKWLKILKGDQKKSFWIRQTVMEKKLCQSKNLTCKPLGSGP